MQSIIIHMINTKRIIKCMFCGNPMQYNDLAHTFSNNTIMSSLYSCKRYQTGINHGEQQLIIHNNEIIQYHLEFKINDKKYWIKSLKDKSTEFYTYEVKDDCGGMRPWLQGQQGVDLQVFEDESTKAHKILKAMKS